MTNLKALRLEIGLTQSQLSEKTGLNMRTLQYYEQGVNKIDNARLDTILKLCIALQCEIDELIEDKNLASLYIKYIKIRDNLL